MNPRTVLSQKSVRVAIPINQVGEQSEDNESGTTLPVLINSVTLISYGLPIIHMSL